MDLFAPTHLLILLLVILIIFGPSRLGDVGGALGKGIRDFKRAINEPENIAAPAATAADGTQGRSSPQDGASLTVHNPNG
jgi:sec-independent protein translocase protein TatA